MDPGNTSLYEGACPASRKGWKEAEMKTKEHVDLSKLLSLKVGQKDRTWCIPNTSLVQVYFRVMIKAEETSLSRGWRLEIFSLPVRQEII